MEFGWSEAQLAYRQRVRDAISELLPPDWGKTTGKGGMGSAEQIAYSKVFCPQLAERGLLTPHWPSEYGGRNGDAWEQFILAEEMKIAGEPRGPQYMNVNWLGPTLMKYGTAEQQREHLGRIAAGEVVWCQGYSEPGAGTDLAALRTRAERRDDVYVVNGSKLWTSYSRMADWCFLLVRTGPARKEISILLVPMTTPGITVNPIPGLVEEGHLNEVFFTDVEVPVANRIGEEGLAWEIITYALSFERVGIPRYRLGMAVLDRAMERLATEGRAADPVLRVRAGQIAAKLHVGMLMTYAVVDERARKMPPSVRANESRLAAAEAVLDLLDFIAQYLPDCILEQDDIGKFYRGNISSTIAAGAYEVQLNLVAQQALGMRKAG